MKNVFQRVYEMNAAFGNERGSHLRAEAKDDAQLNVVLKNSLNILYEFGELMVAFGYDKRMVNFWVEGFVKDLSRQSFRETDDVDITKIRDSLCDINVYSIGSHYKLGYDAEEDTHAVVDQVMTRFIKNEEDLRATIELHKSKGVSKVEVCGKYPQAYLKSTEDQPDAPKGKFLKSASAQKVPAFVEVPVWARNEAEYTEADAEEARRIAKLA